MKWDFRRWKFCLLDLPQSTFRQFGVSVLLNYTSIRIPLRLNQNENNNMAQGPFLLNLYWESQYFRVVFEITRMEIAERHEVQLTVEGELEALCLHYLSPGWIEFVIFLRNLATSEIGRWECKNFVSSLPAKNSGVLCGSQPLHISYFNSSV